MLKTGSSSLRFCDFGFEIFDLKVLLFAGCPIAPRKKMADPPSSSNAEGPLFRGALEPLWHGSFLFMSA
jgi:hypothetical protein